MLLGVVMYFSQTKNRQCFVFACFCLFSIIGAYGYPDLMMVSPVTTTFFDLLQCRMLLALPFMLLYNGKPGRKCKWFFYWYYPAHRYLIGAFSSLIAFY